MTITSDITGLESMDIICSVYADKKWKRVLMDKDENDVNIHKLEVERSFKGSSYWILCLYNRNTKNYTHIFHLNKYKFKIWKSIKNK